MSYNHIYIVYQSQSHSLLVRGINPLVLFCNRILQNHQLPKMAAADVAHRPKMSWLTVPPQLLGRQSTMDFDLETEVTEIGSHRQIAGWYTVTDALFLLVTLVHHCAIQICSLYYKSSNFKTVPMQSTGFGIGKGWPELRFCFERIWVFVDCMSIYFKHLCKYLCI